jgi:hypothetical protein
MAMSSCLQKVTTMFVLDNKIDENSDEHSSREQAART